MGTPATSPGKLFTISTGSVLGTSTSSNFLAAYYVPLPIGGRTGRVVDMQVSATQNATIVIGTVTSANVGTGQTAVISTMQLGSGYIPSITAVFGTYQSSIPLTNPTPLKTFFIAANTTFDFLLDDPFEICQATGIYVNGTLAAAGSIAINLDVIENA